MTEQQAMNKKCPFAFHESMGDFLYCMTDLCMSWQPEGYCSLLSDHPCKCSKEGINGSLLKVQQDMA